VLAIFWRFLTAGADGAAGADRTARADGAATTDVQHSSAINNNQTWKKTVNV